MKAREWFVASGKAFCALVAQVNPERETAVALGVWSVRELIGHTSRALTTVETYLSLPVADDEPVDVEGYFIAGIRGGNSADIAERGRQAASGLGNDLHGSVCELVSRVNALVDELPADHRITTPVGVMLLDEYLKTRAFELTVHSIDLAKALDVPLPDDAMVEPALDLAVHLRLRQGHGAVALLALTGRNVGQGLSFV